MCATDCSGFIIGQYIEMNNILSIEEFEQKYLKMADHAHLLTYFSYCMCFIIN